MDTGKKIDRAAYNMQVGINAADGKRSLTIESLFGQDEKQAEKNYILNCK